MRITHRKTAPTVYFFLCFGAFALLNPVAAAVPAPSGVSATGQDGAVSLSWSPEPAATAYYLYRTLVLDTPTGVASPTATATSTPTGTLTPPPGAVATVSALSTLSFTDFQVTNGRRYSYSISGFDLEGLGPSTPVTAIPFGIPQAVQAVTIKAIRSNALDLSWAAAYSSFPVSFYQISRAYVTLSPTPPGIWNTSTPTATNAPTSTFPAEMVATAVPIATVLGTSFTDDTAGSLGSSAIYYVVRATDNQMNQGALPTTASGPGLTVPNLPPVAPKLSSIALATPMATYGIRLIWNGGQVSEAVTAYQVLSNGSPLTILPGSPPTVTYDDQSIPFYNTPGPYTSYTVRAMNVNGTADSNSVSQRLYKSRINGSVQVTPNATANSVTVKWSSGTAGSFGLKGYRVFKELSGPPIPTVQPGTPAPTATDTPAVFADIQITPGITPTLVFTDSPATLHGLRYWVEPYDQLDMAGVPALPTPAYLNLAPTPVAILSVSGPVAGTNNQMGVTWSQAGAGFFKTPVEYFVFRGASPTPVAVVPYPATNYQDFVGGAPGTVLNYRVAARDIAGNISDLSSFSSAVTLGGSSAPLAPLGLSVTGDATSIRYGWLSNPPADNVDHYGVFNYWPSDLSTATPNATVLPSSTQVYTVAGTIWNASFNYLAAHNLAHGFSAVVTLAGIPVDNYQVSAVVDPTRAVSISWDPTPGPGSVPPLDSFIIYRSTSSGAGFVSIGTVPITQFDYVDSDPLSPGVKYFYRVTARAAGGGQTAESPLYPMMTPTPEASVLTWPKAPAGVTAVGAVTQTTLYWIGNDGLENVLDYNIEIQRSGTPASAVTIAPSPTISVDFEETPGFVSSYRIRANNVSGSGDYSGSVSVLSDPGIQPTAVLTPPSGASPTPGTRLAWISNLSYPGVVSGYNIYHSTTVGFLGTLAVTAANPVSFVSHAGAAGVTNYYKAVATGWGLSANPAASNPMTISFWPNRPVIDLLSDASSVSISWAVPGNVLVTGYTIYRSAYPNITPVILTQATPPVTNHTDASLISGSAYYYWVEAQGESGPSGLPTPQAVLLSDPPTVVMTPGPGRNTLSWLPVTVTQQGIVTGYVVYRSVPTPGTPTVFIPYSSLLKGMATTQFVDTGLTDGVTYHYKVAASALNGNPLGPFSNEVLGTVLSMPVTGLRAVSGDGVVQISWEYQGTPNNTYILERKLGTDGDSAYTTLQSGISGTVYVDSNVTDKTFYTYRMITVTTQGVSMTSEAVNALPAKSPIVAVRPVAVIQDELGNSLTWWPANTSANAGQLYDLFEPEKMYPLGGYRVYRSIDSSAYEEIGTVPPTIGLTQVVFNDAGATVIGGESYTYLVRAFDNPPDVDTSISTMVHETPYDPVLAKGLRASTALDRNAIRPFGLANEQKVNIRLVVDDPGRVVIRVYTLSGVFVRQLVDKNYPKDVYTVSNDPDLQWDAKNMNGTLVSSGVYLITTEMAGGHREFQKVAVIK